MMPKKIAYRYRSVLFAAIMSASTVLIVSGIIVFMRSSQNSNLVTQWMGTFITAWPIVFIAILIIAPQVNKLLNLFVENH